MFTHGYDRVFILCLLFAIGCANNSIVDRQESYKTICNSWLNHSSNELVRSWGPPTSTYNMPNGNKTYTWSRASSQTTPVVTWPTTSTYRASGNRVYQDNPMGLTTGGDTVTYYCNTSFEVNSSEVIIFWRFDGNACYAN
jgi:hypothetical protein